MKFLLSLAIASLFSVSFSLAQCDPGYTPVTTDWLPVPGYPGCFAKADLCIATTTWGNNVTTPSIVVKDIRFSCSGIDRTKAIDALAEDFFNTALNKFASTPNAPSFSIPPCPFSNDPNNVPLISIANVSCATAPIPTGLFVTYPDGSNGPQYVSYACTNTARCFSYYKWCCEDPLNCPVPNAPKYQFISKSTIITPNECGTRVVYSMISGPTLDGPTVTATVPCYPQDCP